MQYRIFGRTGKDVSALGFRAMRLPTQGSESEIDEPAAIEMTRHAIDQGVNIPLNFELFNNAPLFQGSSKPLCRNLYRGLPESERAQACEECGTYKSGVPRAWRLANS